ncbi:hypothetical protein ACI2LC_03870 [Nonomuraea wenchangensis]|uniref:hypothetical protein n=1 Tax=Nonomuraea wenchangensis TaxID=568860 RepID=UPI0034376FCF
MRTTILAALTAAALAWPAALPAHAAPHHGADSIRYASIKSCPATDVQARPCGDWRLVLHSGKVTTLPDAEGVARDAKGRKLTYLPAPIAVSGDGRKVAYFTRANRLAVRTLGGGVRLLPGAALPRVGHDALTLRLSDDGARLAVTIDGDKPRGTRVFDTATGARIGSVPTGRSMLGFSYDGDELLASAEGEDNAADLVVHDETGEELLRATPPQVVAANGPQALAADGRTVAAVVQGGKPELVTYDMETDQVIERRRIALPRAAVQMVDWTGATQVTVHLATSGRKGTAMTIVRIDTETGAVTVRDRYTVLKDSFVFAACGG